MWDRIKVKTKPTLTPIALDDLKKRIRVDFDADDAVVTSYLNGAVARIDGPSGIGYALMEQTWVLSLDCFPAVIQLPGAPISAITSIKYYDPADAEQTLDSAEYRVDLAGDRVRIEPVTGWPSTQSRFGAVTIEYQLGAAISSDVPEDLIDAVCLLVAHRYENRQAAGFGTVMLLPLGYESIISEYRRLASA